MVSGGQAAVAVRDQGLEAAKIEGKVVGKVVGANGQNREARVEVEVDASAGA